MRQRRRELSASVRRRSAAFLCRRLAAMPEFINCRRLACYFSHEGEIDPVDLLPRAWRMKKQVYMPVLDRLAGNRLWFAPYQERTPLCMNRYRIPEPRRHFSELVPARWLDLLLMPLVAFDTDGNRLGMGGGYYDRTLSYFCHRHYWTRPKIIGLAYEFQRVGTIERMSWDVPLDAIVTEQMIYRPAGR